MHGLINETIFSNFLKDLRSFALYPIDYSVSVVDFPKIYGYICLSYLNRGRVDGKIVANGAHLLNLDL